MKLKTLDEQQMNLEAEPKEVLGSGSYKSVERIEIQKGNHRLSMALAMFHSNTFFDESELAQRKHGLLKDIGVSTHATMRAVRNERGKTQLLMTDQSRGGKKWVVSANDKENTRNQALKNNVTIPPATRARIEKKLLNQAKIAGLNGLTFYHDCPQYIVGMNTQGNYELEDMIIGDLEKVADRYGSAGQFFISEKLSFLHKAFLRCLHGVWLNGYVRKNRKRVLTSYYSFLAQYHADPSDRETAQQAFKRVHDPMGDMLELLLENRF